MRPSFYRVASRYLRRTAMEHASEDAMKAYLKDHPNADPKNHSVRKDEAEKARRKAPSRQLRSPFEGVTQERVSKVLAEHRADFEKMLEGVREALDEHAAEIDRRLSDGEATRDELQAYAKRMLADDDSWKEDYSAEDLADMLSSLIDDGELPKGSTEKDVGEWVRGSFRRSLEQDAKDKGLTPEQYMELEYTREVRAAQYAKEQWAAMSEGERKAVVLGPEAGRIFERQLSKNKKMKRYQKRYMEAWIGASDAKHSHALHGLMESLGISGSPSRRDLEDAGDEACDPDCVARHRSRGSKSEDLRRYAEEVYAFQQAFYQSLGLDEITVWRGTGSQAAGKAIGEEMFLKTRELSSWSTDAYVAAGFGRVLEVKIPVSQVFASYATYPDFKDEGEVVVMGSSDLSVRVDSPEGVQK